jgi:hypothetical protein
VIREPPRQGRPGDRRAPRRTAPSPTGSAGRPGPADRVGDSRASRTASSHRTVLPIPASPRNVRAAAPSVAAWISQATAARSASRPTISTLPPLAARPPNPGHIARSRHVLDALAAEIERVRQDTDVTGRAGA